MKRQPARAKIIAVFLDINDNSPLSQPLLKVDEVWLQVAEEQRRLAGRGCNGRVHVQGYLDVARGWGHAVDRLKRTGEINPPWATPARMPRRDDVAVWKDASKVRPRRHDEIYGLCKTGSLGALACRGGHRSRRYWGLWPRRFFAKVPCFLSTRRDSCRGVLCLGLNPYCSARISPRTLISYILANRIFSSSLLIVSKRRLGW